MLFHICVKLFKNPPKNYRVDTEICSLFGPLTSKCDLDLGVTDLDLASDTPSHSGKNVFAKLF